jgi:hypothetical protein
MFALGEICRRKNISMTNYAGMLENVDAAMAAVETVYNCAKQAAYRVFRLSRTKDAVLNELDRIAAPERHEEGLGRSIQLTLPLL